MASPMNGSLNRTGTGDDDLADIAADARGPGVATRIIGDYVSLCGLTMMNGVRHKKAGNHDGVQQQGRSRRQRAGRVRPARGPTPGPG
jgi:hypothetical protein